MTSNPVPSAPAARGGVARKGRAFFLVLAAVLGVAALAAWIALGVGLYVGVERDTRLILAVVAALTTEGLFWTVAAALGLSVWEARKRIWRKITGRG